LVLAGSALLFLFAIGCKTPEAPSSQELIQDRLTEEQQGAIPAQWTVADVDPGAVMPGWLATLADPKLEAIVFEVQKNNFDLKAAGAQVDSAAALAKLAGAQLKPAVTAGLPAAAAGGGANVPDTSTVGASLDVTWEVDVWGRIRAGVSAAELDYESAVATFVYARESLAAQAAKSWFLATETRLQLELAEQTLADYQRILELVEKRQQVGQVSSQDVHLARADVASAQEALRQAQGAYEQAVRSLEVLLGRYPSAELEAPREFVPVPPPVPAGLPSEVLERRPDLVAADREVAAAFLRTEEARLAKLPRITLTGSAGITSSELSGLSDPDNALWSLGAGLAAPIFTGGALEAQEQLANAQQEVAIATYAQAALRAFSEVETALSNETLLQEREGYLRSGVEDNQSALRLSEKQYEVGRIDLLSVLQMQLRVVNSRKGLIRIQNDRLAQRVNLHLALGGGFEEVTRDAQAQE
jgi:NodT family efflux transporter outer membrane factor (OMF) lipoprotein